MDELLKKSFVYLKLTVPEESFSVTLEEVNDWTGTQFLYVLSFADFILVRDMIINKVIPKDQIDRRILPIINNVDNFYPIISTSHRAYMYRNYELPTNYNSINFLNLLGRDICSKLLADKTFFFKGFRLESITGGSTITRISFINNDKSLTKENIYVVLELETLGDKFSIRSRVKILNEDFSYPGINLYDAYQDGLNMVLQNFIAREFYL